MNRRYFLIASLCTLAGALARRELAWKPSDWSTLIPDIQTATEIGRAYLRAYPGHGNPAIRYDRLQTPNISGQVAHLEQWFINQVREDFRAGDTVVVKGWQLARTEAALCGLLAA